MENIAEIKYSRPSYVSAIFDLDLMDFDEAFETYSVLRENGFFARGLKKDKFGKQLPCGNDLSRHITIEKVWKYFPDIVYVRYLVSTSYIEHGEPLMSTVEHVSTLAEIIDKYGKKDD